VRWSPRPARWSRPSWPAPRTRRHLLRDSRGLAGLLNAIAAGQLDRLRRPSPGRTGRRREAGCAVDVGLVLELAGVGDPGVQPSVRRARWDEYLVGLPADPDPALRGGWPSKAQFYRWLSGELVGLPYPDHCRILEGMFPGWRVDQLFQAHDGGIEFIPEPFTSQTQTPTIRPIPPPRQPTKAPQPRSKRSTRSSGD
jgi:hypothetical protein